MTQLQKCSSYFRDSKGFDMIHVNGLNTLMILAFFLELHEMVSKIVNTTIFGGLLLQDDLWLMFFLDVFTDDILDITIIHNVFMGHDLYVCS